MPNAAWNDTRFIRLTIIAFILALLAGMAISRNNASAAADEQPDNFAAKTLDLGMVVSDAEKSIDFYTKVIGFTYQNSITIQPQTANDAGLSDVKAPVKIHFLKLGTGGPGSSTLKFIQFTDAKAVKADTTYIHSALGFRYVTIMVKDMGVAVERAAKLGHKPIAKGPAPINGGPNSITCFRDPDGNFVELVGPIKK